VFSDDEMPTILLAGCTILNQGKIVLVRKKNKDFWELPGGTVTSKKDIDMAAAEKAKAQIGVDPVVIQHFTVIEYQKNGTNIEATILECYLDSDVSFIPGEDVEEVKWFDIKKLSSEKIGDDVKTVLEEF